MREFVFLKTQPSENRLRSIDKCGKFILNSITVLLFILLLFVSFYTMCLDQTKSFMCIYPLVTTNVNRIKNLLFFINKSWPYVPNLILISEVKKSCSRFYISWKLWKRKINHWRHWKHWRIGYIGKVQTYEGLKYSIWITRSYRCPRCTTESA